jgi:sulfite reductase alpha subunit-like flavoprotein
VFGLGNTQYEHYNCEGKFVDNMCEKCGGKRMLQLGLGDDDKNIRGDFDDWMTQLWPALREHLGMEQSSQDWLHKV